MGIYDQFIQQYPQLINYLDPDEFCYLHVNRVNMSSLVGSVIKSVHVVGQQSDDYGAPWENLWRTEKILIETECGAKYIFCCPKSNCCDGATIEDINGDIYALAGERIVSSEEKVVTKKDVEAWGETSDMVFYNIRTINHDITIRFFGTSNGHYDTQASLYSVGDISQDGDAFGFFMTLPRMKIKGND